MRSRISLDWPEGNVLSQVPPARKRRNRSGRQALAAKSEPPEALLPGAAGYPSETVEATIESRPFADAEDHEDEPVDGVEQAILVTVEVGHPCVRFRRGS
jgi:hypothetical protein